MMREKLTCKIVAPSEPYTTGKKKSRFAGIGERLFGTKGAGRNVAKFADVYNL